jgi:ribonuclease Z
MPRELTVLGSASQVPTRHRNHNGYFLRWDAEGFLFDPGEGTQRQFAFAGIAVSAVTRIFITHFHGDHCLGLPGVLQRMSLDRVERPVTVAFPAAGAAYFERLRHASVFDDRLDVRPVPVTAGPDGVPVPVVVDDAASLTVEAAALSHSTPTVGWRIREHDGRRMLRDRLAAAGVAGPDVGRLQREGAITVDGRRVALDEVSVERPGQRVAVVMDTGWCAGARSLAEGADLLVSEATFGADQAALAKLAGHLTAAEAGRLAAVAGARRLVLTHFSQRYPDAGPLLDEAAAAFGGEVVAARDLLRVPVPRRRPRP